MQLFRTTFGEDAHIIRDSKFQILILAGLMAPLGPSLVSPMLDSLTDPFGVSESAIGLMISAFTAPGILLIPLAGSLADRYGRRIVLITGLLLFGLGGTTIALTTDFRIVIILRLVQGIGASGILPVIIASIGDIYEGSIEATGQGLRFMSAGLSQTVFPALAGVLVVVAWQYPFLIYGLSFPIAVMVALWFDEPTQQHGDDSKATLRQLIKLISKPHVLILLFVFVTPPFLYFGFLTYISILVRFSGGTPGEAGLIVAINSIAYAIAASQSGRITAQFESRLVPLLWTNGAMGIGLIAVGLVPDLIVVALGSALFGLGFGITLTLYRSIATGLAPDDLRASLVSLGEAIIRIGSTGAPLIMSGAIALVEPVLGFSTATRWTVCGVAISCSGIAVVGLILIGTIEP